VSFVRTPSQFVCRYAKTATNGIEDLLGSQAVCLVKAAKDPQDIIEKNFDYNVVKSIFRLPSKLTRLEQGRTNVRWRLGQETSLAPPCSNRRSFGRTCTVLKKVLATLLGLFGAPTDSAPGTLCPLYLLVTPLALSKIIIKFIKFDSAGKMSMARPIDW